MAYNNEAKTLAHPGKLGDHPVGGAVGAVIGAAEGAIVAGALEGAILGTAAGLPGMAAGVAIGGVVGALAGKEFAQEANPNEEEIYWRDNYKNRAYFDSVIAYDSYASAYRYGIEAYSIYAGRSFDDIEPQLAAGWDNARGASRLTWDTAKLPARDAYERLVNRG